MLVGATAARAFEGGLRPALAALVPVGEGAAWGWLNVLAIVLALLVWPLAAAVALRLRREAR